MFIYKGIMLYVQNLVVNTIPYSLPELCSQVQYLNVLKSHEILLA